MTQFNYADYGVNQTVQQAQEDAAANGGGGSFEIMPPHVNQLVIDDMVVSQNENTGSVNLMVTTSIVGEQFNGRKMWNNFNLVKKDGQINQITQYQLSDLAAAVGFPVDQVLTDPTTLLNYNQPFNANVKVEKGSMKQDGTKYEDKNVFANPKAMGVAAPVARAPQQPQPAQQGFASQPQPAQQGFASQPKPAQTGFNQPAQQGFQPSFTK